MYGMVHCVPYLPLENAMSTHHKTFRGRMVRTKRADEHRYTTVAPDGTSVRSGHVKHGVDKYSANKTAVGVAIALEESGGAYKVREGVVPVLQAGRYTLTVRLTASELPEYHNRDLPIRYRHTQREVLRASSAARQELRDLVRKTGGKVKMRELGRIVDQHDTQYGGSVDFALTGEGDSIRALLLSATHVREITTGWTSCGSGTNECMPVPHTIRAKQMQASKVQQRSKFAAAQGWEERHNIAAVTGLGVQTLAEHSPKGTGGAKGSATEYGSLAIARTECKLPETSYRS